MVGCDGWQGRELVVLAKVGSVRASMVRAGKLDIRAIRMAGRVLLNVGLAG